MNKKNVLRWTLMVTTAIGAFIVGRIAGVIYGMNEEKLLDILSIKKK